MVCKLVDAAFTSPGDVPVFNVNFMPLNHLGGRVPLGSSFRAGGTSYFVPESDLSTLFEDWALVRPTELALVPRVVDMLLPAVPQPQWTGCVADGCRPREKPRRPPRAELREKVFGGRVLGGFVGTAPLAARDEDVHRLGAWTPTSPMATARPRSEGRSTTDGDPPPVIDYKLVDVPELGYFLTDTPYPRGELLIKTETMIAGLLQAARGHRGGVRRRRLLPHR